MTRPSRGRGFLFGSGRGRVICLTGAMRDEVLTRYRVPRERVRIVPNGVDLSRPAPGTDARAARELLFVGRLVEQKNVLAAVEAMAELPRDVTLRIVGEGPSLRIECRIPGADANPYLALAALVVSAANGIRGDLKPPPAVEARLCQECADERFQSWRALVDVLMRDD